MMKAILLAATLASAGVLSGCATPGSCEERDDYVGVRQIAQIEVPDSLDALPETEQLQIPVSSTPPDVERRCLEKPPRFSDEDTAAGN